MTPEHKFSLLTTFGPAAFSALIAALVSWLVTRYMLKHSPDYQNQLDALRSEMSRMTAVHEQALAHQKAMASDEQHRRESARRRPDARLVSDPKHRSNTLRILSDKNFSLDRVDILTESGVQVATIPGFAEKAFMGLNFVIPASTIQRLVEPDHDYRLYQKTTGKLQYVLTAGTPGTQKTFELPFRVMQDITGSVVWNRMEG